MDDFGLERPELTGTLINLEFGAGGRIYQLWASDPSLPEENEEFQFVLTPVNFGEEFAEDYYPGTILLGARSTPEEPWVVDRNKQASPFEEEDEGRTVSFEYDFPLLPDLRVTGRFYETAGTMPQICWDVRIANRGRVSVEVGELAFPFALNNLYEGRQGADDPDSGLQKDRVRAHKFLGGAASYLCAQRMTNEPPGLLVFPGDETAWEFCSSVPTSLSTSYRWGGIPVMYVHSRASVEREGWGEWFNEHTSLILEPGDSKVFQTRFVPLGGHAMDSVQHTLGLCKRPAVRLLPGAVAPMEVGIALELLGTTPTQFYASAEAEMETDADEDGGFCFVRPAEPGPLRVSFVDTEGRLSHAHLLFTEPIKDLIAKRADWIVSNQVCHDPGSALDSAILPANLRTGHQLRDAESYAGPFAIESGLSDALFLAEKNTRYPLASEIRVLDDLIDRFVKDDLQNPGDGAVGSSFADFHSVALHYGRAQTHALVFNLHHAMFRIAKTYGGTCQEPEGYLHDAYRTACALFEHALPSGKAPGVLALSRIDDLCDDLAAEGMDDKAGRLAELAAARARDLRSRANRHISQNAWDPAAFEELFWAARRIGDTDLMDQVLSQAFAARSLAPSWWSYGSDPRIEFDPEGLPHPAFADKGELHLGYTGPANSLLFFAAQDRDYNVLPDVPMRLAFGGMLGSWSMVRADGAASMGFCPDSASKHRGAHPLTGDLGLALFHYLRGAAAWVMPSRTYGVFTFGCHFEMDDKGYSVRPWDGLGRRVVLRQIGFGLNLEFGRLVELRLDARKRWLSMDIENPCDREIRTFANASGLWGRQFEIEGKSVQAIEGELRVPLTLPPARVTQVEIRVVP